MRSWFYHPGAAIIGGFCRLFFGLRVVGVDNIPRTGAFIVVANHCSNLDPPMLGWATGHQVGRIVHFMAKIEMRTWPVIGWLATQSGVYFVRRGEGDRAAQRFSLEALADGRPIALFPEGTRSRDGRMRSFKDGAAYLAMRSGAPILPVGIAGSHRMFPGRSRLPHRTRVRIRIGRPFTLPQSPSGRVDRDALADATSRIQSSVAELLPAEQRPAE
ncbi:MAG TPA: lysophospholipid acyltransferase family protein [Candidatus Limnocylindria bacterium]|nr:lysophospholipid acyltransferase family protein [Candidatus Limnocylindria bacterium]